MSLLTQVNVPSQAPDLKDLLTGSNSLLQTLVDIIVALPLFLLPLVLIWGGIMYMMAGSNDQALQKAKNIIKWAAVGIGIYLLAIPVINLLLQALNVQQQFNPLKLVVP